MRFYRNALITIADSARRWIMFDRVWVRKLEMGRGTRRLRLPSRTSCGQAVNVNWTEMNSRFTADPSGRGSRPSHGFEPGRPGGREAGTHAIDVCRRSVDAEQHGAAATSRCSASARSCGNPADLSTDARLPARCPAASPSSAASGPAVTIGPIPGITSAIAASTRPPNSPRTAAGRESSRSTPGVASIRAASVRSSA